MIAYATIKIQNYYDKQIFFFHLIFIIQTLKVNLC